jgi:hypothetical protein
MVGKGKELVTHALSDERNSAPVQQGPRHQAQNCKILILNMFYEEPCRQAERRRQEPPGRPAVLADQWYQRSERARGRAGRSIKSGFPFSGRCPI